MGYLEDEKEVLELARKSAICSHAHPEGIAGAQAVAWTAWALKQGVSVDEICQQLYRDYDYYIHYDANDLHKNYTFDSPATNSVPVAIYAALKSSNTYEECIRTCLWIGGDTDTIMAMAGLMKSQQCTVKPEWEMTTKRWLWKNAQGVLQVVERFEKQFSVVSSCFA